MDNFSHSDAFKRHALSLIEYAGMTLDEAALQVNIPKDTLERWSETIDLLDGINPSEKQTLLWSADIHERSTFITPPTNDGSKEENKEETKIETVLQTWIGRDHLQTKISSGKVDWTVPSYDHSEPLLSRGEELGKGGMGRVISGIQASTGREVAVKEVRADKASKFIVRRLLQEAWITGLLEHPNIIPIYTIDKNEHDQPMILMKRVSGRTWHSYIQHPETIPNVSTDLARLKWNLDIFLEVCSAVHYAHDKGILHRDIKPENVMLGDYGEVYLLDWGIAVAIDDRYQSWIPTADQSKGIAGTPSYIAPEMITAGSLSIQSDIYLLGAVLYEIAEGKAPHEGISIEGLVEHCQHFVPTFERTPTRLQPIIRRAMAINPDDRYSGVEVLQHDIQLLIQCLDMQKIIDSVHAEMEGFEEKMKQERPSRTLLYEHFVAVRFGLKQVNKDFLSERDFARYEKMLRTLCEWELQGGRPETAALLLYEFRQFPQDIEEQISIQKEAVKQEQERLRKMDIEQSDTIGIKTRAFVIILTILGWAAFPIWSLITGIDYNYGHLFMQSTAMLSWMLLIGVWAKDTLSSTGVNRRTFGMLLAEPLFHTIADLCAWTIDMTPSEAWLLRFIVWSTMLLSYGILMEVRFLPIAFAYSLMTIGLFTHPEWADWVAVGLNAFLLVSMGFVWRKELDGAEDARKVSVTSED